ncbi:hypothetical protein FACS1894172_14710 [Spirochaetia bacterium]|nr:hypothetical protein FACS1894172_14710 [Spirochaetia bacterium]
MKKVWFLLFFFNLVIINIFSVNIKYELSNGTVGKKEVPEDVIEIIAFKGAMNFITQDGSKTVISTRSPMKRIDGLEKLLLLKRLGLIYQLDCNGISFIINNTLEYLLIDSGITLDNMDFLNNLPNLHYLGLIDIEYKNNIMNIENSLINYLLLSHINYTGLNSINEQIIIYNNIGLQKIVNVWNNIKINNNKIVIIENQNYMSSDLLNGIFKSAIP